MAKYDELIDWKQFYSKHLNDIEIRGDELKARCPFHTDSDPSFTANLKSGLYKCYGCDASGNGQTFVQEFLSVEKTEALKILNREAGIEEKRAKKKYTVEDYAEAKKLPLEFLRDLKMTNTKNGITIPYIDESGSVVSNRQRYGEAGTGPRFTWSRGSKVNLYGLWRLAQSRKDGYICLVEGESDCHTLWYHGIHAVGVPGASVFQPAWMEKLEGLKIYVFQEDDTGGEVFVRKVSEAIMRASKGSKIEAYIISLIDHKDPSELHCVAPERFKEHWKEVMANARELDYENVVGKPEEVMPDAPVQLKQIPGWQFNPQGIFMNDEKSGFPVCISRVPVIICKRLRSLETGQEKIEIAFKRDDSWHRLSVLRSVLFQSRSITALADYGLTISSENAKPMVKFLSALEAENIDILQRSDCVSQLGWHGKNFIPSRNSELVVDVDPNGQKWLDAYHEEGSFENWKESIAPCRDNPIFRFMLAASFAAPLLRLINHRIFIVHNWGKTRSGKTAALKGALSVWGDPDALIASFYATQVGLERLAGFFRDLPLGIDEKQVVSGNGKRDFIDSLMYMISLGSGKVRGAKAGGLQNLSSWRTIAITTGEEPLTNYSSHSGMHSRVLEIYGAPFPDEASAQKLHNLKSYGHAGDTFINEVIKLGAAKILDAHGWYVDFLENHFKEANQKYLQTHLSALALISATDAIVDTLIFGESDTERSRGSALDMALDISDLLIDVNEADIIERAYDFITDWILSSETQFTDDARSPRYGYKDEIYERYYIFPSILKDALERQELSYKAVMQGLAEKGYIVREDTGRYGVLKRCGGKVARFIVIDLKRHEEEGSGE